MHNPYSLFAAPAKPTKVQAPDRNEIATLGDGRDLTRSFVNPDLRMDPQDAILQSRTYQGIGGYDLFRDLLTDWTVFSALQQRRLALVCAETEVIPGGTKRADKNAAAFLEETLTHIGWDRVSGGMHFGIYYGFGVGECLWGQDGATVTLDQVRIRDRRRFAFDGDQRLRLMTLSNPQPGDLLPDRKFWVFQTGADHDDEPYGMGLAHWLYWPVLFKRSGIKFWLIAAEKFGAPTAAGWFPPGTSKDDQARLLAALNAIQTDAAIIMPDGMRAELIEAKRATGGDHAALCGYMDAAINKIILSQMAPADSTGAKLNVSAEEPATWQRLVKADADLICESFNAGPVRWLTEWNFPGAALPRVYRRTEPSDDLSQRSEIERRIFDLGYRPTLKQIEEEYDGEWEVVSAPVAPESSSNPGLLPAPDTPRPEPVEGQGQSPLSVSTSSTDGRAAAFALPSASSGSASAEPVEGLVDRLGQDAEPLINALLEPVRAAMDASADLMDFRERLLTLYPEMDAKSFADLMGQALAVADAQGQWEAAQPPVSAPVAAAFSQSLSPALDAPSTAVDRTSAPPPISIQFSPQIHVANQLPDQPPPQVNFSSPEVVINNVVQVPDPPPPTVTVNAIAAPPIIQVQPAEVAVQLNLPPRKTETAVVRDSAGNIVTATQIETDLTPQGSPNS